MLQRTALRPWQADLLLDLLLFALVAFVPALSHVLPFPVYMLDPMRILMFVGLLFTQHRTNALGLALLMPMVSVALSGHPPFAKAILISLELAANLFLFYWLYLNRGWHIVPALVVSIVGSKIAYYAGKFLFIQMGWVEGALITTPFQYQAITIALVTLIGAYPLSKLRK